MEIGANAMDQRLRVAVALAVLAAGVALALVFGRPGRREDAPRPSGGGQLVLRKPIAVPAAPATLGPSQGPVAIKPPDTDAPSSDPVPLRLSGDPAATSRWGVSLGTPLPDGGHPAETHKIVDGDTLAALAERYLGSASRAMEIYEANRGVLASPQLLPIGVELKLPPRQAVERPLVPVERGD